MQYAQVLINQKTKSWDATFTYGIKPDFLAEIKIGSIVGVPFGRKNEIDGVVIGLKRGLPADLKGNIKSIKRVLQPNVTIKPDEIECAKWLAQYYLTGWSEALFAMVPPIPKREIAVMETAAPTAKHGAGKTWFLIETDEKRYAYYRAIINKNKAAGQATMIVFPDLMKLKAFRQANQAELENFTVIQYQSGGKNSERFETWLKIRAGQAEVILTSRMGLLSQMGNVATVIIDEVNHSGHNDDQAPRYNSVEVAQFWQKKLKFDILIGDINPTLKELVKAKEGQLELIKKTWPKPSCHINIIDMNKEKGAISLELERQINGVIERQETMVILLPRKGSGAIRKCADCGYDYQCPNCHMPLSYNETSKTMGCQMCNFRETHVETCPKCRGVNIRVGSFGVEKVAGWIQQEIGGRYPIINLDRETKPDKLPQAAIYVATQAVFRYPIKPAVSVVMGTDLLLAKPDYSASETTFYTLFKLAMMTQKRMIIQTQDPELAIFLTLANAKYQKFAQQLLVERLANHYPPYGQLVKIQIEDETKEKAEKTIHKVAKGLGERFRNGQMLGPVPAYFGKERGNFRYNLIIKSSQPLKREEFRDIAQLGRIEFDPDSLL